MRRDLNKLLCERERRGGYRNHRPYRHTRTFQPDWDPEDGGGLQREGMTFRYGYNKKTFNENLTPLRGQIRKAVGKRWDKFYSELSKVFDMRSVINQHIVLHLNQFVERDIFERNGELWVGDRFGSRYHPLREATRTEYYVDPRDGIIKRNRAYRTSRQISRERRKHYQKEIDAIYRELPDGSVLRNIEGNWFHFTMKEAPEGYYTYHKPPQKGSFKPFHWANPVPWDKLREYHKRDFGVQVFHGESVKDVFTGEHVYSEPGKTPKRYHATKQSASRKHLKQAGIVK